LVELWLPYWDDLRRLQWAISRNRPKDVQDIDIAKFHALRAKVSAETEPKIQAIVRGLYGRNYTKAQERAFTERVGACAIKELDRGY
jgi:predicted Ser/Thr protein kinase